MFKYLIKAFQGYQTDKVSLMSAGLAYYTLFSIAPFLLIVISFVGLIFGESAVQGQVFVQLNSVVGSESALFLQNMLKQLYLSRSSTSAILIGIATSILAAIAIFNNLHSMLNTIFKAKSTKKPFYQAFLIEKLGGFLSLCCCLLFFVVLFALSTLLSSFQAVLGVDQLPQWLLVIFDTFLTIVLIFILFTVLYKVVPAVRLPWRTIMPGALLAAFLFSLIKLLFGYYVTFNVKADAYGAAGALVVLLIWIYFSAQIFLFGAEVVQALRKR